MKELWWEEAAKYQVLPLNNQPGALRRPAPPARPPRVPRRASGRCPEAMAPNLREPVVHDRRRARRARRRAPSTGVIVAHGSHAGGYAVYLTRPPPALHLQLRRHRDHDRVGERRAARPGEVEVRVVFTPAGELAAHRRGALLRRRAGRRGHDPAPHAAHLRHARLRGRLPAQQPRSPTALEGRAEVTPGVLGRVVIEVQGKPKRNPEAEERKDLATQ